MSLHTCTWCGHIHDPEDGRCDAHAHVGLGPCPCPGDDRRMVDLDAVMEGNRNVARNIAKRLYRVGFPEAAAEVESLLHEFGGSANQPADDRRMVDLDVIDHWIRQECGAVDNRQADAVADELLERFGGSAPNKDQP